MTCWQGHDDCATYDGGPCLEIECTCEVAGVCMSCPPRTYTTARIR